MIERIIEHASDDLDLLCNCSLTCRQLYPRSSALIISQFIFVHSKDRMSAFCDFLQEKPKLQSFIQSIIIFPANFPPYPLINLLPHLKTLFLTSKGYKEHYIQQERPAIVLHSIILSCYYSFGKRIRNLSLSHLSFRTSYDLFRLLLAFPETVQISCYEIVISSPAQNTSALEVVRRKLSKQLRLESLTVRIHPSALCPTQLHNRGYDLDSG